MGMNQQAVQGLQQGLNLFGDVMELANGGQSDSGYSAASEEQALMMELDAKEQAMAQGRATRKTARKTREEREQGRATQNARWGQSGVAMSGSKALIRDASLHQDTQEEEDILFEGDMAQRGILEKGNRDANMFRINQGGAPKRSTLSMGSSIYDYRR